MVEAFAQSLVSVVTYQCIGVGLFLSLELAFPKERVAFRERATGFIFLLATALPMALVAAAMEWLRSAVGVTPIPLQLHLPPLLATVVFALWVDLQFYFTHRMEHRFLWRFHAVHHSVRNLSAANSYHHWTEPIWIALTVGIPLMFVDVQVGPTIGLLSFLFTYQQFYLHSASRPHFGPLRWLLVDNRYHRIHHSLDPAHHDRNFGAMTPLWDWLFGTLHMPRSDEWPAVGLSGISEPSSLAEWESLPRRIRRGSRSPTTSVDRCDPAAQML